MNVKSFTSVILHFSFSKLSFENARNVPPIVTESGITLYAPPPWNFPTVTTLKCRLMCQKSNHFNLLHLFILFATWEKMIFRKRLHLLFRNISCVDVIYSEERTSFSFFLNCGCPNILSLMELLLRHYNSNHNFINFIVTIRE